MDIGGRTNDSVDQAGICIHTNVGLYAEVPLVTLLGLVHLGILLPRAVLGGTGCGNQGGVNYRAGLKHQAFGGQGGVNGGQQLDAEVVIFEQVAEPKDGALIGEAANAGVQVRKLAVQRNVVQRLFHGRVRQAKPLLHAVDAQHGS